MILKRALFERGSRSSLVGIANNYRMGGSGFLIPGHKHSGIERRRWGWEGKKFYLLQNRRDLYPDSYSVSTKGSFPDSTAAGCVNISTHIHRVLSSRKNGAIMLIKRSNLMQQYADI